MSRAIPAPHPIRRSPLMTDVAGLGAVVAAKTADLRLAEDNPRNITQAAVDAVIASLKRFGWQQPIVVDTDNVVVAGHTRLKAAQQLNLKTVPVVIADQLTADEAKAYRITDNRTHDYSTWDLPALSEQLDDLAADFSVELGLADWETLVGEFEALAEETVDALEGTPAAAPAPAPSAAAARPAPAVPTDEDEVPADEDDVDPDILQNHETEDEDDEHAAWTVTAPAAEDTDLDMSDEVRNHVQSFALVVCFHTKAQADAAGPAILELPGAFDVRYKR